MSSAPTLRAEPPGGERRPIGRRGLSGTRPARTQQLLLVHPSRQGAPSNPGLTSREDGSLPVALNTRTGNLGVVLGTLIVHLRDATDAPAVARDHDLLVASMAWQLSVAFLKVPVGRDLIAAAAALSSDERVVSAELEVSEGLTAKR